MDAGSPSKQASPSVRIQNCKSYTYALPRLCAKYHFEKPNDRRALDLMNAAAKAVVTELPDVTIAYGVSDEYRYS
jgi:tRNA(His) 5'-end guanylyltransferase